MRAARIPATTASNRPDLLHSFWRPGRRAAPWTPGGRSVRVPARAPRGRAARRGGGRGLTARVACGACRCTLRGAFYSARHSDPLRRAPGGRTGPRGRWSPPRPARRTGPIRSPRPAALACLARWPPQRRVAQPLARRQPQRRRNASSIRAAWFWRSAAAFRLELRVFFLLFPITHS